MDIIFAGGKFRAKSKFANIAKISSTRKIGVIQYSDLSGPMTTCSDLSGPMTTYSALSGPMTTYSDLSGPMTTYSGLSDPMTT